MINQKNLAPIVGAIVAGIIISVIADKYIFSTGNETAQVQVVPVIHTDFKSPPSQYFNSQAIDPTQIINIGPNNSQQPFTGQ